MFKERLKGLREEKGLKKKEMAEVLQIDETTYGKYELGKREPDFNTLARLADFFGVSTDYLLGRTDNRNHESTQNITLAAHRKDGYDRPLTEDEKELIDNILAAYRKSKEAKKE